MTTTFDRLTVPTEEHVAAFNRWNNDEELIPLIRPNKNAEELSGRSSMTLADLEKRLSDHTIFLIYEDGKLVGEMNYMIDPPHLFKKEPRSAWIGITIGEPEGRGKGIGALAMTYIEGKIKEAGLKRIELGVFEYNTRARRLYEKMGYSEVAQQAEFTYWQGRMWADVRMEKQIIHI
ncbi:GNAT family N-acetyltransferase [Halobacillus kuroshimensis]|uniref:GNAT family N-acetyltransferase n=1 Tax=Halobacillus kuroshimensis TaxID=302481 RepID=A0ABS3DRF0_9BACI|nr:MULTISPECIES: GNAT family N-acetyltransferase [Halobacillus]MBN8233909.1 GNAT family N-acetyltransferase [Halobacillus kuroshimensis]